MSKKIDFPARQVHLDFHTGPAIPDVGREFDAGEFAGAMSNAHVNSVTVFAKCHHGHLYYETKRPERHPGLKPGLDLLRGQVEALHARGIAAPIYISVQCDEYAANAHPDWVVRTPENKAVKWGEGVFKAGWQILDMSSPYQEFLAEQTEEVLRKFHPVDGIFFDMCWDQPSTSKWAIEGMKKQGLDPELETDRAKYAHGVSLAYMKRFYRMVKRSNPKARIFFNSRPFHNLKVEKEFLEQIEIEALPTGSWGYLYFPKHVRFARGFGKPYLGMTARFHKSWADFGGLKPYAALEYEISQMMANGAMCSVGDQLHPRGVLDRGAYELIGKVYARVEQREPWLIGATSVAEIGVMHAMKGAVDDGATRMLTQLKHQFDMVDRESELEKYRMLILPDSIVVDEKLNKRLGKYLKDGGTILASGMSGLSSDGMKKELAALPVKPLGMSPYSVTYCRFGKKIGQGVPDSDHVMYERSVMVKAAGGGTELAQVVEPYFERSWDHFSSHNQTPGDNASGFAAAVIGGRIAYIAYPVFGMYGTHGNYPIRLLVKNVMELLLPEPLLRVDAPTSTEATVTRQKGREIVHLLQYCPERRTPSMDIVEDIVPLFGVGVSLKLGKMPRKVYLAPEKTALPFTYENGRVNVTVPEVRGHAMVVVE